MISLQDRIALGKYVLDTQSMTQSELLSNWLCDFRETGVMCDYYDWFFNNVEFRCFAQDVCAMNRNGSLDQYVLMWSKGLMCSECF